jgi:hypothetical protein
MRIFFALWIVLLSSLEGTIHVIGDSHAQEFSTIQKCEIHYLGPRTMHRIGRDGLALLNFQALGIEENDVVVLAFGEIDVRCHIGRQRDLFSRDLDEVIDTLLDNYFHAISSNRSQYACIHVAVYTATPPISLATNIGYESYGSVRDRVFITKTLNQKLIQKAHSLDIAVIDVYDSYADVEGILIPEYSDGSVHISSDCNHAIHAQLFAIELSKLSIP